VYTPKYAKMYVSGKMSHIHMCKCIHSFMRSVGIQLQFDSFFNIYIPKHTYNWPCVTICRYTWIQLQFEKNSKIYVNDHVWCLPVWWCVGLCLCVFVVAYRHNRIKTYELMSCFVNLRSCSPCIQMNIYKYQFEEIDVYCLLSTFIYGSITHYKWCM